LNEASLSDVSQQPFRKHPAIPHTLDGFGCVICHGGQGAATTVAEAHHSERAGEEPILPPRYIESGCGQCHQNALPGTPQLNLGRTMLTRYGCVHCHAITLPDGSKVVATDHPPSLAHIADKTTREWIYSWLKDPQAFAASTTMPNYKLSDADASDISAYLVSASTPQRAMLRGRRSVCGPRRSIRRTEPVWRIVLLVVPRRSECGGEPGGRRRGSRTDAHWKQGRPQWLTAWLENPRIYDATTPMPHYRFTAQQIVTLAAICRVSRIQTTRASVHLDTADGGRLPTDETHRRAGMRRLPRNQWRAEA